MIEKDAVSSSLIELYIGTFNRAPTQSGLSYWVDAVSVEGWNIEDVAASFFDQTETIEKYPESMSTEIYIDTIFNNVLGRSPGREGSEYWATALVTGAISRNNFILAVINGAKSGGTDTDKALLQSKHDVGQYFAIDLELEDLSLSSQIMKDVTHTTESLNRAKSTLDLFKATEDLNYVELDENDNTEVLSDTTDWIYALGGNDIIHAAEGKKWIHAGDGNDSINDGNDSSTLHGGNGDDTIYGNEGYDVIYAGAGNDFIHGNADDDQLYGDTDDDYLYGDAGNDILYGGDGDDVLNGGDGDDLLYGNDGDDTIHGDDGVNIINGEAGSDILHGGDDNDTICCGEDNDTAYGRDGDDRIEGMDGDDLLNGGNGEDNLYGNNGNDTIVGGSGDDFLSGEAGNDTLRGEAGSDTLSGGAGSDEFIFGTGESTVDECDSIIDFELQDKLVLVRGTGSSSPNINNQAVDVTAFSELSAAANAAAANNQVSWFVFEDDTYVVQDVNDDGTFNNDTDLIVKLYGVVDFDNTMSDSNHTLSNIIGFA